MCCSRRRWLAGSAAAVVGQSAIAYSRGIDRSRDGSSGAPPKLALEDFAPRSMLHVPETKVERARFPAIDFHTHLTWSTELGSAEHVEQNATVEEAIAVMDRKNVRVMVNLTGGYGRVLDETLRYWRDARPERFVVFTEPMYNRAAEASYAQAQADEIGRARSAGARGLKVLKTLGLYLRERVTSGPLVKIDDRRFDPMWEAAGAAKMPVGIHTSDPEAFFLPTDRLNERYEELNAHPDWSFHGRDFPSDRELQEARNRVIERHPGTHFVLLHVANAENLGLVSEWLDRYPNTTVEIGARIGELGRQPRAARKFFDKYQDRVLFGTDAVPKGFDTPQQIFGDELYEIYYRFLETEDEYFDYAPASIPPQGRWRISGLGLPEPILKKVYYENAARVLGLQA